MNYSQFLNIFGLILGMIGVAIIFKFGPPQPNFERGVPLELEDATLLEDGLTVAEHGLKVEKLRKRHQRWSKFGLLLIFFGFALQLCGVLSADT